jgi:LPS export ABC transporter protein LptC
VRRFSVRIIFVAAIAAGVVLIFLNTAPRVALDKVLDISRLQPEHLPELLQRIRDFHRIVTRDGKKLFEVSATEASYFRDEKAVEILEPELLFYHDGVRVAAISGGRGYLLMDGNEIESVEMSGTVEFRLSQFIVRAETIKYQRAADRIITLGETEVSSPEIQIRGNNLTFDLSSKTLSVDANVDMMLRPADDEPTTHVATPDRGPS